MKNKIPTQKDIAAGFAVKFIVSYVVLYALVDFMLPAPLLESVNRYNAAMAGFILRLLGMEPLVHGVFMSLDGFSIRIITECSAVFVSILFFSFVLAYPTSLKNKAIGLFGIPVLNVVNLLRLVVVFLTGVKFPDAFKYVHVYLGQIVMIIVVFWGCMFWLRSVVTVEMSNAPSAFFIRFIAFSSIPFMVWLYLNKGYVLTGDYIINFLFSFSGYRLVMQREHEIYYHTFNLISFSALVLATQSMEKRRKINGLLIGLPVLFVAHLMFRICNLFSTAFHMQEAFIISHVTHIFSQYFLPFALWFFLIRKEIFRAEGIHTCPICGVEKVGIIQHIKAKHGEHVLKDKRVKPLLAKLGLRKDEEDIRSNGYIPRMMKRIFAAR